jgi:predicted DCC family thiol-disulfide oxidoreductase YuxK
MTRAPSWRDDPAVPPFDDSAPVAVMDADCTLCSWGARMIHRLDRAGTTRICPAQSPLGSALLRHHGMDPGDPESWLFLHDGTAHRDFDAVIAAGRQFGGWALATQALRLLPRPLSNGLYRLVARNRHALFGRSSFCALPDPAFLRRLLR